MTAQTITEYAVKGTVARHGKYQLFIEQNPFDLTDRQRNLQAVADLRERQADWGITPDAELVTRTVTVSDWTSEEAPAAAPTSELTADQAYAMAVLNDLYPESVPAEYVDMVAILFGK